MEFLIILVCSAVATIVLRNGIARHPAILYVGAAVCDAVVLTGGMVAWPPSLGVALAMLMRRGGLGTALFVIVMYIGVLPRDGWLSKWLRPIRTELSIAACLFITGHVISYLALYLPNALGESVVRNTMLPALALALCLVVLMVPLGVTSLKSVKRRMQARWWSRIQKLAYGFYALMYAHIAFMIVPAALNGGRAACVNCIVYTLVFGAYVILRVRRAFLDSLFLSRGAGKSTTNF